MCDDMLSSPPSPRLDVECPPTYVRRRVRSRRWSREDDKALSDAVSSVGSDVVSRWKLVAALIDGRTPKQCRARWTEQLVPYRERRPWTQDEMDRLCRMVDRDGRKWAALAPMFEGRTPNDLKNTYARIVNAKKSRKDSLLAGVCAPVGAVLSARFPGSFFGDVDGTEVDDPFALLEMPTAVGLPPATTRMWRSYTIGGESTLERRVTLTTDMWTQRRPRHCPTGGGGPSSMAS